MFIVQGIDRRYYGPFDTLEQANQWAFDHETLVGGGGQDWCSGELQQPEEE